jgi:hypothetical protein
MYRVFKLDLSGGDVTNFRVPYSGEKLIYHWGTQTLDIKLNSPSNDAIKCRPKQEIRAPFSDFFVDAEQRNEVVELVVMNPAAIDLGGGEVRVMTDTGHYDTIAQRGFIGIGALSGSDTIGIDPHVQLWNPEDSNVLALVDTIECYSIPDGSTAYCYLKYHNGRLAENFGEIENKYIGGRESNLEIRYQQRNDFGTGFQYQWNHYQTYNTDRFFHCKIDFQYVLPPGWGLHIRAVVGGASGFLRAQFQFREYFIEAYY